MSEATVAYEVNSAPHARVPKRWLSFLFRMATLERGKMYNVTVIIPVEPDREPTWAISGASKVENGG